MKKSHGFLGLACCALSLTLAGSVLARASAETADNREEQTGRLAGPHHRDKDCHLFMVKRDLSVQEAGMEAGEPVNTLHLFMTGADRKIIKDAQVVTTLIDQHGNQQSSRALPFKGGYLLAIEHLAPGEYLVEAEIVTRGQLLTDAFRFNKA